MSDFCVWCNQRASPSHQLPLHNADILPTCCQLMPLIDKLWIASFHIHKACWLTHTFESFPVQPPGLKGLSFGCRRGGIILMWHCSPMRTSPLPAYRPFRLECHIRQVNSVASSSSLAGTVPRYACGTSTKGRYRRAEVKKQSEWAHAGRLRPLPQISRQKQYVYSTNKPPFEHHSPR